jgi:hypothetical protein
LSRESIQRFGRRTSDGLGEAIQHMKKHWSELTLFLRVPGAPMDNNIRERALKKVISHRKNALFFKTLNGARVGDIHMSLIHTAELNGEKPWEYLVALLRHAGEAAEAPGEWTTRVKVLTEGDGGPLPQGVHGERERQPHARQRLRRRSFLGQGEAAVRRLRGRTLALQQPVDLVPRARLLGGELNPALPPRGFHCQGQVQDELRQGREQFLLSDFHRRRLVGRRRVDNGCALPRVQVDLGPAHTARHPGHHQQQAESTPDATHVLLLNSFVG